MNTIPVLIVEDDPMVADINKQFTQGVEGFTVAGMARTREEALNLLAKKQIDLVILDIYLPEGSGLDILVEIRRQELPVDVIAVTAADDSFMVSKILRLGVVSYITKPFKFDRYRAVLEAYRCFRRKAEMRQSLGQEDIDSILSVQKPVSRDSMPKNFNIQTLELVIAYLEQRKSEFLSAEEIAAGVGLARVTARRYLEYLVQQGRVLRNLAYAGVGRPVHLFRIISRSGGGMA